MPANSLNELFAYEHAIESAWQTILIAAGINTYIEATDIDKTTPFVDLQLRDSIPQGQRFVNSATNVVYYNAWIGTLVSRAVTQRGKDSAQQADLIGKIRIEAQSFPIRFTDINLPFHQVQNMEEHAVHRGMLEKQLIDWAEFHHKIQFAIRPNAWPA